MIGTRYIYATLNKSFITEINRGLTAIKLHSSEIKIGLRHGYYE
jgi:hypothetical protein